MAEPHLIAARLVESLFDDGGRGVLVEAGFSSWERAFRPLPPQVLAVPQSEIPAEDLLTRVRDFWTAKHVWRPAIAATRALMRLKVARHGNDDPRALLELGALGALASRTSRTEDASKMLESAYEGLRSTGGGRDVRLAIVAANYANHLLRQGQRGRAQGLLEQAWKIRREVALGTQGMVAAQLAEMHIQEGSEDTAVEMLIDAWDALRKRLGLRHKRTRRVGRHLATGWTRSRKVLAAEPILRDLYESAQQMNDPAELALSAFELGIGLRNVNLKEEAYRRLEESIRITRTLGDPHPALSARLSEWSKVVIVERKRPAEGEGILREALDADQRLYGEGSPEVAGRYAQLGHLCAQFGRVDEAMGYLDPAVSLLRSTRGDEHPQTIVAVRYLVDLLYAQALAALEPPRDREIARWYQQRALEVGAPVLGFGYEYIVKMRDLKI